jgi:nicotinamide riboside transporter PnuC
MTVQYCLLCDISVLTVLHGVIALSFPWKPKWRNWSDGYVLYSDMSCFFAVFQVVHLHGTVHLAMYFLYEVSFPGFFAVESVRYLLTISEVLDQSGIFEKA